MKLNKNFDKKPHRAEGGLFTGYNVTWHQPVWSISVGCSSRAVMPLLRIVWSLLLHTPNQRLAMLFNEPKIAPVPAGSRPPIQYVVPWAPKWHLDRFTRFCTAHPCSQHTDTQTVCSNRPHLTLCAGDAD